MRVRSWQSAIAAKPTATYKGYLLGGLCWFAIPFTLATTLGLAGRALDLPITIAESDAGLTPPAVAVHLMGKGGAFLMVLQLFMAVTAAGSAEQIAVSSLAAYDIYKEYINPVGSSPVLMHAYLFSASVSISPCLHAGQHDSHPLPPMLA